MLAEQTPRQLMESRRTADRYEKFASDCYTIQYAYVHGHTSEEEATELLQRHGFSRSGAKNSLYFCKTHSDKFQEEPACYTLINN